MKKIIKNTSYILLSLTLLCINFLIPSSTKIEAKSLRNLKSELSSMQQKYESNQNNKRLTESQISSKRNSIAAINIEIDNVGKEIENLTKEIKDLNVSIIDKQKEIKEIMNYYQISNGESAYLEYVFNAESFTDFIYRMAIAEELSNYNKKLVAEYNETIKENEQKKKDLAVKTVSLNEKYKHLEEELSSLRDQLSDVQEESVSIEDDIKNLKNLIKVYENAGCKLDEDINSCGSNQLPPGTAFYRPVVSGYFSSSWGYRPSLGDFHKGNDYGVPHGTSVYSVANGRVVGIIDGRATYNATGNYVCGGNMIFITHVVNGTTYTSGYAHLATINVSLGQTVTYNTVIATSGGVHSIEYWDNPRCSTGAHLHFQISTGNYINFNSWSSRSFDPASVINMPPELSYISGRNTRY